MLIFESCVVEDESALLYFIGHLIAGQKTSTESQYIKGKASGASVNHAYNS